MAGVEVDFGAGPRTLDASTRVLGLTPGPDSLVPADSPIDWSALAALPNVITVNWSGPERGIIDAIGAYPGIRFLYWDDAVGDLDLRSTHLGTLRVDGAGVRTVRLPQSIETLLLRRPSATLEVEAADLGSRLDLRLFQYGPDVVIPAGLRRTPTVWLWVGGEVSARVLADLTELADLRITFDKPPGVLTDLTELGRHRSLHALRLDDAHGLDPRSLPELPSLDSVELSGTRHTIAAALQARFRDTAVDISVDGAMSEAWLAEHMDNPFRDWVEDSEEFATAACAAYNRAFQAGSPATAEAVLRRFIADLSAINDEYELIDTGERDHAWTVFYDLGRRWQVPDAQLDAWFDDGRRF